MDAMARRRTRLAAYAAERGLFAVVLEDFENLRSRSLRYLCGHPGDAILFVFAGGKTVLVPWDVNMAREKARVDEIVPYTDFHRSFREAVATVLRRNGLGADGRKIEVSARTPHTRYRDLLGSLGDTDVVCGEKGCDAFLNGMRAVKDTEEAGALRRAGEITNALLSEIEELFTRGGGEALTEVGLAQLVEREALALGAEALGFETLAAGPSRSWGIHAFPTYTNGPFGGRGLSILDFGVRVEGYTSDVTVTVARGPLSPEQRRMLALIQRAYDEAVAACRPGASPQEPARRADAVFAEEGWRMPHSLGHGIGLDTHEGPLVKSEGAASDPALLPGMVFTIEPGLYHPEHGGARLENDVVITDTGVEVLTRSRILVLD